MYYDNMNYINLRKYYSETLGRKCTVDHPAGKWCERQNFWIPRIAVEDKLRFICAFGSREESSWFEWSYDGESYEKNRKDI